MGDEGGGGGGGGTVCTEIIYKLYIYYLWSVAPLPWTVGPVIAPADHLRRDTHQQLHVGQNDSRSITLVCLAL